MHLKAATTGRPQSVGTFSVVRPRPGTYRPRTFWRYKHVCRAAADSEKESDTKKYDQDYQLRRDVKSVTRTVLEGKPLLQQDRAKVDEEEAKERFFGRLAVLSLGVGDSGTHAAYSECMHR